MSDSVIYVETRGPLMENVHRGSIAIVDERKEAIYFCGDIESPKFYRSASKPLQALPVFARSLDRRYGIGQRESAIFSASHLGEQFHVDAVRDILSRCGFQEEDMIMAPSPGANGEISRAAHCCSGKHAGLMMLAQELCGDYRDYWKATCAAQQEVVDTISLMSSCPRDKIALGIDGCGVPVFAVPLKNMALSFLRLACPDLICRSDLADAAVRLGEANTAYPLMIRGTGSIDSLINSDPNLIAKSGRFGVYCIGFRRERLGAAIKIDDGDDGHLPVILAAILRKIGYDNSALLGEIDQLHNHGKILSDNGMVVGICEARLPD